MTTNNEENLMGELYLRMGFIENPFSKYSAEEEKTYLSKIMKNRGTMKAFYLK